MASQIVINEKKTKLPGKPWGLYVSLFTGRLRPNELWNSLHFRLKFMLRSLIMPLSTYKLLTMITRHPNYEQLLFAQPRLPCRLHRPYLATGLNRKEKLNGLLNHYSMMNNIVDSTGFCQHLGFSGLGIARLTGKDGGRYLISFSSWYKLDREGESSIILKNAEGQVLAEISFIFCIIEGQSTLLIGGLQGPNTEAARLTIQQATKNLHGLFPKKLVFEATMMLGNHVGVESIIAVSNKTHVYQSLRYKNRKQHIYANYNEFWETQGGLLDENGLYTFRNKAPRKSIEDIVSKKRAEYRRRYDLMDDMQKQISTTFQQYQE